MFAELRKSFGREHYNYLFYENTNGGEMFDAIGLTRGNLTQNAVRIILNFQLMHNLLKKVCFHCSYWGDIPVTFLKSLQKNYITPSMLSSWFF